MVGLDVDDWIGIRNTKLGRLVIRGDEPAIRGCELLSKLVKQSTKGDVSFYLSWLDRAQKGMWASI